MGKNEIIHRAGSSTVSREHYYSIYGKQPRHSGNCTVTLVKVAVRNKVRVYLLHLI